MKTMHVLGTPLAVTTYPEMAEHLRVLASQPKASVVDFSNSHIVTMRRTDPGFRALTEGFDLFVPDGMPLIWCLNSQGAGLSDRVYGPAFMQHALLTGSPELTHYFLGGSEECVGKLKEKFLAMNPRLKLVGVRNGYFGRVDEAEIVREIKALSPDCIWVGLGTPKQQEWIERNRGAIRRGVLLAVGFAFDVNAGTKSDAPAWMQRRGLTWLFRLCSEPRRLAWRYVKFNALFLFYLVWDGVRGRAWKAA
jgi:N-acetylglucosaminyldiphosphoundecaprenol N-acetyl-beta-D-mannosaminyltransferase